MTALILQREFCKELKEMFKNEIFLDSQNNKVPLNVYEQHTPIRFGEDDSDYAPYAIVRIESGVTKTPDSVQEISLIVILNCFDEGKENAGHTQILNMIQKIYERFFKKPLLSKMFVFHPPFEWMIQEDELTPYYFGAISMTFQTLAIRREDELT